MAETTSPTAIIDPKGLRVGSLLRYNQAHDATGTIGPVILRERKADDTGWWVNDANDGNPTGGLVDWWIKEAWELLSQPGVYVVTVTRYMAQCHIDPECGWSQEHLSEANARIDAEDHARGWHS